MSRPRLRQPAYRFGLPLRVALRSSASIAKRRSVDHGLELSIKELCALLAVKRMACRISTDENAPRRAILNLEDKAI